MALRRRWILAIAVVLLFLPLPLATGSLPPATAPIGPALASAASVMRPSGFTAHAVLPGSDPAHEARVNVPEIALRQWQAEQGALRGQATNPNTTPVAPAPAPVVGPALASSGTITGKVYDLTHGRPIVGASVTVEPFGTTFCSPSPCSSTTTGTLGDFTLSSPAGAVILVFTAPYFVDNRTWVNVPSGGTVSVGTLFLVHDGFVTGIVRDNSPNQNPIAGSAIDASSRDGAVLAFPGATSAANGSFTVAVPPLPSKVAFGSPGTPARYQPNVTFVNLTPYETLDIGVVHLEGGVPVSATLVDATTGLPILSASPSQLTVCTRRAVMCLEPAIGGTGPDVAGYALPGPSSVTAYAIGYVANATTIPDVPNTDQNVDLGTIALTPLAAIEISINLTGGPPPPAGWPMPDLTVNVCSLDGVDITYQTPAGGLYGGPCWPRGPFPSYIAANIVTVGTTAIVIGPPMHDVVVVQQKLAPGDPTMPDFPIAATLFGSTAPLFPPAYSNVTWVNATPDRVTMAGSVDVTAGTYLQGNVSLGGLPGSEDGAFSVQACSTEDPEECGSVVVSSDLEPAVIGCASGPTTFCAPSPPGPVMILVTAYGTGASNRTWVSVLRGCCAQDTHPTDIGWINLTIPAQYGSVSGSVVGTTGGPGSSTVPIAGVLVNVEACPVGPAPIGLPSAGCTAGVVNLSNGQFNFTAPLGWDVVSVHSNVYQGNWTWVDVTGNNSTGVIELAPKAIYVGQVRALSGGGLFSAIVEACAVGTPLLCQSLGETSSDGQYNGTVAGGPLPWGTYMITASSSGYAPSWTWVNSTPGVVTTVPTITLPPLGSTTSGPGAIPAATNGSVGAWVDGRIFDADSGYGVPVAQIDECSVVTGGCLGGSDTSTAGGTFNVSLLTGQYYLKLNAAGYTSTSVYVNATTGNFVHLGAISMDHFPYVHGRVVIHPWESLALSNGIGAPVNVIGCAAVGTLCGPPTQTDTGGFFNASVPTGGTSGLEFIGRALPVFGTVDSGFDFLTINVAAVGRFVNLTTSGPSVPAVEIFGAIAGRLMDGSTWNTTDQAARGTCEFCRVQVIGEGSQQAAYTITQVGGGGDYTTFLPTDGTATMLIALSASSWWVNETVAGGIPTASVVTAPPLALPHYGWVTARVIDTATGAPIPYVYVSASAVDRGNGTTFSSASVSRNDGFVNVSAPLGPSVVVNVTAAGYFPAARTVSVGQSQSVGLGNVSLVGGAALPGVWFRSVEVNTVNASPLATVVDARTHAALPGALVAVTNSLAITTSSLFANGLGQFLLFSPSPPPISGLYVTMTGYDPVSAYYDTSTSATIAVPSINVTGNGIVAGRVLSQPSGAPVYNAEVDVCPNGLPACGHYGFTNASGFFWVAASPGYDVVTVVSETFLANVTLALNVFSDRWAWVGTLPVFEFASVFGTLRGLPSGALLTNANVSLCSPFGTPVGSCDVTVPTDANGAFYIPSPPSTFILMFQAPGFNTSYLPVLLLPGENLSIGTIFLFAYGSVVGRVVSSITGAAITNATVYACAQYASGLCSPFVRVDASGSFQLSAAPGPNLLTSTAPGFFDNFTSILVPSGATTPALTIELSPLATNTPESLSGLVVAANRLNAPIPGAFVSAELGGVAIGSGATDAAGRFTLAIVWGSYSVVASAPGYRTVRSAIVVHTNVSGVVFALPTMTYDVTGTARDALSGVPLNAVAIREGGTTLAETGSSGTFFFGLANGSYSLIASASGATGSSYLDLPFTISVIGHSVLRDVQLTPDIGAISGVVVDANSGLPIPTASVAPFDVGTSNHLGVTTVSATGAFSLPLAAGSYLLNVSAPGYESAVVPVSVPGTSGPVTVALVPLGTSGTLGLSIPVPIVLGVLVGLALAVVALVLWRRSRPPPPPPRPRWTLEDLYEPVE